jgi:preprotein translocase subunit SecE
MATTEHDVKEDQTDESEKDEAEGEAREPAADAPARDADGEPGTAAAAETSSEADDEVLAPTQLGTQRFVYAAYFAGGICVAFLMSKFGDLAWTRLSLWKPEIGEPREEIVMTLSAIVGTLVAVYYYRDAKTRTLIDEIASELSKVSWPDRPTVMNSTLVVIITTLVATTFFALMDRFWGFVTNLVYGAA